MEGSENRSHRAIDPGIDRAELILHALRRGFDSIGVSNVGGDRERLAAKLFDLGSG
jgi:hypothetical protein